MALIEAPVRTKAVRIPTLTPPGSQHHMLGLPLEPFGGGQTTDQALYQLLYGSVLVL